MTSGHNVCILGGFLNHSLDHQVLVRLTLVLCNSNWTSWTVIFMSVLYGQFSFKLADSFFVNIYVCSPFAFTSSCVCQFLLTFAVSLLFGSLSIWPFTSSFTLFFWLNLWHLHWPTHIHSLTHSLTHKNSYLTICFLRCIHPSSHTWPPSLICFFHSRILVIGCLLNITFIHHR